MFEPVAGELFSIKSLLTSEKRSPSEEAMPALTTTSNCSVSVSVFRFALGLGGVPDEPHAANVLPCIAEGSGVGKVKEPPVLKEVPLTENDLNKLREDDAVTIVFKMQLTEHMEVKWETVLWARKLYIHVPSNITPEGSKEGFVSLLEYAEETLKCTHIVVCLKKNRPDRACLIRTFMFLGFVMLAPDHPLAPTTGDYLCMAYVIE